MNYKQKINLFLLCLVILMGLLIVPIQGVNDLPVSKSIEFVNADLRDIFRGLAEIGNFQIVLGQAVRGEVTLSLKNGVSAREAVSIVAKAYSYNCKWAKDSAFIGIPESNISGEKHLKVFSFNYAGVAKVAAALEVVVPKERIKSNLLSNHVSVTGTVLELQNSEEIITLMDRETPPLTMEIRILEAPENFLKEMGIDRSSSPTTDVSVCPLTDEQFRFIAQNPKITLLATPDIRGSNNREKTIFIGDKIPVFTEKVKGGEAIYNVQETNVGNSFKVFLRIIDERKIFMKIQVEVNKVIKETPTDAGVVPSFKKREVYSFLSLETGQKLILTGLLQRSEYDLMKKGSLKFPVLGGLFEKGSINPVPGLKEPTEMFLLLVPQASTGDEKKKDSANQSEIATKEKEQSGVIENKETVSSVPITSPTVPGAETTPVNNEQTNLINQLRAGSETLETKPQTDEEKTEVSEGTLEIENQPLAKTKTESKTEPVVEKTVNLTKEALVDSRKTNPVPDGRTKKEEPGNLTKAVTDPKVEKKVDSLDNNHNNYLEVNYTVKKGDTLTKIARKFGSDLQTIVIKNNLGKAGVLKEGATLTILVSRQRVYLIKPKETLWRIAKRYGTTLEVLKDLNGIADETKVKAGQELVLPVLTKQITNPQF